MLSMILGWFGIEVVEKNQSGMQYAIVRLDSGQVVEVLNTSRKAHSAQRRWHNSWVFHKGPQTTIQVLEKSNGK